MSALFLSGCDAEEPGVSAGEWAATVCTTLDPWRERIDALTVQAQSAIGPDTGPEETKAELVKLLDGAATASETARAAVSDGAAAAVEGGEDARATVVAYLEGARDAYASAGDAMEGLDAGAEGFYDQVAATMAELNTAYAAGPDLAGVSSVELSEAFATVGECG
ncbi:hypothetical protein AB0I28_05505 [Phytomonospora sp. NPDC050363]|uniref:hypothetical protein n=1 Tax=Phytomonospora sp. NPDC050363 TaxID=3155642 RepID=UPI0033E87B32